MGSLYTSIIPCLIARGVGASIRSRPCPKILLLNSHPDRETHGMSARHYVWAICDALRQSTEDLPSPSSALASPTVDVSPAGGEARVVTDSWLPLRPLEICGGFVSRLIRNFFDPSYRHFITDVLYIDSPSVTSCLMTPTDLQYLRSAGIRTHPIPPKTPVSNIDAHHVYTGTASSLSSGEQLGLSPPESLSGYTFSSSRESGAASPGTGNAKSTQRSGEDDGRGEGKDEGESIRICATHKNRHMAGNGGVAHEVLRETVSADRCSPQYADVHLIQTIRKIILDYENQEKNDTGKATR